MNTDKWANEAISHFNKAKAFFEHLVTALGSVEAAQAALAEKSPAVAAALAPLPASVSPMQLLIARLFAEAPKLLDDNMEPREDQAPAVECTVSLARGTEISGALSVTPEGAYRIMSKPQVPDNHPLAGKPMLLETFFAMEELSSVTLIREMTLEQAAIASGGSRIIQ